MAPSPSNGNCSRARAEIPTRVLVVDEEPLIRWSICAALAAGGYDPVPAAGVPDARTTAAEWPPPLVAILDSRFAHGDREDLRAILRGVYPDCRLIIMTTDRDREASARNRSGAAHVIQKPFDIGALVRLVDELTAATGVSRAGPLDG